MLKPYGLMADLHIHPWSAFAGVSEDGLNTRMKGLHAEIMRCAEEVHKAGGTLVVMAGDVFHVRGSVSPVVLNSTKDLLAKAHERFGTVFIIIPGNHDLEGKETTRLGSAVTALECAHVIVHNDVVVKDHMSAVLIPWFERVEDLKAQLEASAAAHPGYDAIIHAPIDGVIDGLPMHGLSPEYLSSLGFRHVYAGHYHNHKEFHGGAVSIGALAHHSWSDIGSRAGFLIVDSQAGTHRWMKSHLPEFIDLTKLVGVEPEELPLLVAGNYVRVRVESTKAKEVEQARQELLDMGARAVLVQPMPKPPASEARAGATVEAGASLQVSISSYVEKAKLDLVDGVSREMVSKAALDVLNQVAEVA